MISIAKAAQTAVFSISLALFSSVSTARDSGQQKQSSEEFSESLTKSVNLKYLLSLPKGYANEPDKKWPLVVFLHGAGERGADLELVKKHGPPKLVEAGRAFPFILISPQCPKDSTWIFEPVLELIDHAEEKYRVDPRPDLSDRSEHGRLRDLAFFRGGAGPLRCHRSNLRRRHPLFDEADPPPARLGFSRNQGHGRSRSENRKDWLRL